MHQASPPGHEGMSKLVSLLNQSGLEVVEYLQPEPIGSWLLVVGHRGSQVRVELEGGNCELVLRVLNARGEQPPSGVKVPLSHTLTPDSALVVAGVIVAFTRHVT